MYSTVCGAMTADLERLANFPMGREYALPDH
jgi:hypothetical protein